MLDETLEEVMYRIPEEQQAQVIRAMIKPCVQVHAGGVTSKPSFFLRPSPLSPPFFLSVATVVARSPGLACRC